MDIILRRSLPKLREKLLEALQAVLPIVAIVLVLCFTVAPVSPSILLCFLLGAAMIVVGIMFFTLGAEMSMTLSLIHILKMKKQLLALLLAAVMVLSLTGCKETLKKVCLLYTSRCV